MNDTLVLIEAAVDSELRERAENILSQLGETPSMAITQFYTQIILQRGIPFELKLPSNI
ncbi:MAG: type II toxin-antitoxin system RelB/DinJ family antitoxin [Lachnospiraceae bacterium]|jgi:addiction module RelB/DinJ family antitoxin|nr:type II toxin-antitoxin system RelB/DinJ family antitoxin [Lachnospiraceae bacterium]MCI1328228.1 type II toxin-antitoxin system RelB/DinJ family antitoxin [Lachnospiraceae bacterium]